MAQVPDIIPSTWLPDPKRFPMQRALVHWTAGRNVVNEGERKSYHLLLEGDGTLVPGKWKIEDNFDISWIKQRSGAYAAHVASFNGGSIGLTMCGCFTPKILDVPGIGSEYPLTARQWWAAVLACAQLIRHFGWSDTEKIGDREGPRIIGHCEVESVWAKPQDGKIDPWRPMPEWTWTKGLNPSQIAQVFRQHVKLANQDFAKLADLMK